MTRAALITTTIHNPTGLRDWARAGMTKDDVIVVSGDLSSPHEQITKTLESITDETGVPTYYLDPEAQQRWISSEAVGWRCIQRRNFALLRALEFDPRVIITVDDDNYPTDPDQVNRYVDELTRTPDAIEVVSSSSQWFNVGNFYEPKITHRGYPLPMRANDHAGIAHIWKAVTYPLRKNVATGVVASLWLGDPDIDAMERIVNAPDVDAPLIYVNGHIRHRNSVHLDLGTWCPFNSQATAFRAELAPAMLMWPHVGRYDDIWASYLMRKIMDHLGLYVRYGAPLVKQARNPHDLLKDLDQELFGMRYTPEVIGALGDLVLSDTRDVAVLVAEAFNHLAMACDDMPYNTRRAWRKWIGDISWLRGNGNGISFVVDTQEESSNV